MARSRVRTIHANIKRYAEENFQDAYQDLSDVQPISIESLDIEEHQKSPRSRKPVREGSATTRVLVGHAKDTTRTGVYAYMKISQQYQEIHTSREIYLGDQSVRNYGGKIIKWVEPFYHLFGSHDSALSSEDVLLRSVLATYYAMANSPDTSIVWDDGVEDFNIQFRKACQAIYYNTNESARVYRTRTPSRTRPTSCSQTSMKRRESW
jgi:hypothetical protein